jgi:hypothetical protein
MLKTIINELISYYNYMIGKTKCQNDDKNQENYYQDDDNNNDDFKDENLIEADPSYGEKTESQLYNYMLKNIDYGQRNGTYFPRALAFDLDDQGEVTQIKLWCEDLNKHYLVFEYDTLKQIDPILVQLARSLVKLNEKDRNTKFRRRMNKEIYLFDKEMLRNTKLRFRLVMAIFKFTRGDPIVIKDPLYFYYRKFDEFLEQEFKINV